MLVFNETINEYKKIPHFYVSRAYFGHECILFDNI